MTTGLRSSLRLRLIVGSAIGVLLAVVLAGLLIGYLYASHTRDRFLSELDHHLDELVALIEADAQGQPSVRQPLSDPQFNVPRSGLYWQVAGKQGFVASPSLARDTLLVPAADAAWHSGHAGSESVLQRSSRLDRAGHGFIVTIASAQHLLEEQVDRFHSDLTLSMAVVALLLIGGAALMVRFGLAPVRRLEEEVGRLRNGEIERLDPNVPAEFSPVVARINALLEAQAQLIARARTESGNLAHNLRTPLALITDEADQLVLAGQAGSAAFLLEQFQTMQRQIDYHLARAAAAGTRGAGTLTAVEPLLGRIVQAIQRLHADRAIQVVVNVPADLRLPFDSGDLAEILSNLIDNAFKWATSTVTVTGTLHAIEIADDGPGIPADQRSSVMNVGTRLDPAMPGTGLGLAATADLLQFYDADLVLDDAPGGGLRATMHI